MEGVCILIKRKSIVLSHVPTEKELEQVRNGSLFPISRPTIRNTVDGSAGKTEKTLEKFIKFNLNYADGITFTCKLHIAFATNISFTAQHQQQRIKTKITGAKKTWRRRRKYPAQTGSNVRQAAVIGSNPTAPPTPAPAPSPLPASSHSVWGYMTQKCNSLSKKMFRNFVCTPSYSVVVFITNIPLECVWDMEKWQIIQLVVRSIVV